MKKVFLSIAVACFIAFVSNAQTAQNTTTEKVVTSKDVVSTQSPEADAKGCGKKAGCCKTKKTETAEATTKSCCKGKDAKCDHDKASGSKSDSKNHDGDHGKSNNSK